MVSKALIMIIFVAAMFLQGCSNTVKGLSEGVKEDWKVWQERDGWIQEHLW